jgi:hypothetical protein
MNVQDKMEAKNSKRFISSKQVRAVPGKTNLFKYIFHLIKSFA